MVQILLGLESAESRSLPLNAQRLVNFFTEREGPDAKSQVPLFGVPGLTQFANVGTGPIRQEWTMGDVLYVVSGHELYSVNNLGMGTLLGSGITGSNVVSMADNGSQLCIVNGVNGYIYASQGVSTSLAVSANTDDLLIVVASIAGISNHDPIAIDLDDGSTWTSTITSISGVTVHFTDALPSPASLGNVVSDSAASFQQITDPNFHSANTVTFFDGYFVFDWVGTSEFFLSGLYDGLNYNGLDFATAESSAEFLVACCQNLQLLFLFKHDLIEMWYDAGALSFPFQRYPGGVINRGCSAPLSIVKQDGAIFFLSDDGVFYRLQANFPIRVSTHAMEHIIAQEPDASKIWSLTYTWEGHKMIAVTLPSTLRTLEFDISTGKWHERESWDENDVTYGRWRGNCAFDAHQDNIQYIGDAFSGVIWRLDWDNFTEGGNTIPGLIDSAPIHHDRKRVFVSRFELDVQAGVGLTTGQGSDPQIFLQWSKDGGNTYSKLQPWRSMGKVGEYLKRLRWLRLGQGRQYVFRVMITDPVRRVIIAAHADYTIGM